MARKCYAFCRVYFGKVYVPVSLKDSSIVPEYTQSSNETTLSMHNVECVILTPKKT